MSEVQTEASEIQEVFGQFAVELGGGVKLFASKGEAATALAEYENGAANLALAIEFTDALSVDGKNAKGKTNVVVAFLNWVDAGRPGPAPVVEAEPEVPSEEVPSQDGAPVTF